MKRKKKKIRLGKNEKKILRLVATGMLVGASLVAPNLPSAFKGKKKKTYQQSFKRVYEKDLIYLSGEKVRLSARGQKIFERIESEEITIKKSAWDGIWRIVAYDIPDTKKKERDYFRKKLKGLGFCELQKSMLVLPYECKEEIAIFSQTMGIAPYVMYLITDFLPRQKAMIKKFGLEI